MTNSGAGKEVFICFWLPVVMAIVGAIYLRFVPWLPSVFYGDDLYNLLATHPEGDFVHSWVQALTGAFYEKYRPVFVTIWFALTRIFHEDLHAFLLFNGVVHTLNAVIFCLLALALSNENRIVSILLTLVFASSRFALYQVTQCTGPVESVALTFFFLTLLAVVQALQQPGRNRWQWMALVTLILASHIHERYLVVSPWLAAVLFILVLKQPGWRTGRFIPAILSLLIPAFNFLVKTKLLGIPFFVGTGSTYLAPNIGTSIDHFLQALFSVWGINHGPTYLIGHDVISGFIADNQMDRAVLIVSASVFGLWLWIVIRAAFAARKNEPIRICVLLFLFGLFIVILVPPVLTIRMEQRWIYVPFCLFLLSFAWACGTTNSRTRLQAMASAIACLFLFSIDTYLSQYFQDIYLMNSSAVATLAKRDIVDTQAAPKGAPLILMASKDHCTWTFIEGHFFELYEGASRQIYCAQDSRAFEKLIATHPFAYVFTYTADVGFRPVQKSYK